MLREMTFALDYAKGCFFEQKCYTTEAKLCVPFRKNCTNVLWTKTLSVPLIYREDLKNSGSNSKKRFEFNHLERKIKTKKFKKKVCTIVSELNLTLQNKDEATYYTPYYYYTLPVQYTYIHIYYIYISIHITYYT